MCDDDSGRLIIDDNDTANSSSDLVVVSDAQKTPKGFSTADSHNERRSPSSSSSSSTTSTSSSSSLSFQPRNNGQQLDKSVEKQKVGRKRKKEDVRVATTPRKPPHNENIKVETNEGLNKKRKTERPPRTTSNKHCQTDDLHQQNLKPDMNVLLDITIVFAPDPNTLYFTTKWKGRNYHGVITDGLSSKNQVFALKRERAERLNCGKSLVQNGQSPKARGKRGLNRAIDRKGRTNPEDFSIFDAPEELNDENKSSKLIKVPDGEAQKMFSRCPHTQCGHVFETVNEVNNHIIFRHVTEPAVIRENTACQYSPIATTSNGYDPIPEVENSTNLCSKCRESTNSIKNNYVKASASKEQNSPYSDVSTDEASNLIKDENDESNKLPTLNSLNTENSLTPRRPDLGGTIKAASNSSTPVPTSISSKQPKRSAITPNIGTSQTQQQTVRPSAPTNFPMSFAQPNAQMINNQQLYSFMNNMLNPSASLQITPSIAPKAGGSITAGSSSFSSLPQQQINIPGSSTGTGGIGIVHPQQLGPLATNGLVTSSTTSSTNTLSSDSMRHKIHELKTNDTVNQSLLGVNSIQHRNASPNNIQRGQQQFVRPPTSTAVNPQFQFFQRMPSAIMPPQQQFINHQQITTQQMNLLAAMMGGMPPGQSMSHPK